MTCVTEFHRAMDLPAPEVRPLHPSPGLVRLRMRLIREEYEEVMSELSNLVHARSPQGVQYIYEALLKELADLRYVVEGAAVSLGLPIDAAYEEVHRSNMSKLDCDGKPIKDAGGKVLKGPNYSPADMGKLIPPLLDHQED